MGHIPLPCIDIQSRKVHVHVHESKPVLSVKLTHMASTNAVQPCSRNAEASECIDTLPGSLVLLCDKQIFCAVNRVSCTSTCTLNMSGSPCKHLCMYTTGRGSLNNQCHRGLPRSSIWSCLCKLPICVGRACAGRRVKLVK